MTTHVTMRLFVEVYDESTLLAAAVERAMLEGMSDIDALHHLAPEGETDCGRCVSMLAQPDGVAGCKVHDCETDEYSEV